MNAEYADRALEGGRDTSLYLEGLTHLQAGRWQEAIRCLEAAMGQNPDDREIRDALAQARYKAQFDASVTVRPMRWVVAWRKLLVRGAMVILAAAGVFVATQVIQRQVAPSLAAAQIVQQSAAAVREGKRYLEAGKLPAARAAYAKALALQPENEEAAKGIQQADQIEALEALYEEGVAAQEAGNAQLALEKYNTILQQSSGYKDAVKRIRDIRQRMDEDTLFARAEADFQAGRYTEAIEGYRQLLALNASSKRDLVNGRIFDCYMRLGQEIIEQKPAAPDRLPQAKSYFTQALALRPRDSGAATEERLAVVYLAGQAAVESRDWEGSVRWFEAVHQQRPGYLSGIYLRPLYDAYIANGDAYASAERYADAWDQYDKAAGLPVENTVVAIERRARIGSQITPTPTPTVTPTPTPLPTPTGYVPPTALPSPTPAPPLATFRNQIVFRANKDEQNGYWVMNPDGSNRRYLGASKELDSQYDALIVKEQLSPDGRCRLYPYKEKSDKFVEIYIRCQGNQQGELWSRKLTFLEGITYDAVWAPDGSRIAFVSSEKAGDDVYVMNPDGKSWWNYTLNTWEWDKHPSFSPDSRKIVFWSNREGIKQLYVIDADGRNLKKIKDTTWDEYDPIWVK